MAIKKTSVIARIIYFHLLYQTKKNFEFCFFNCPRLLHIHVLSYEGKIPLSLKLLIVL